VYTPVAWARDSCTRNTYVCILACTYVLNHIHLCAWTRDSCTRNNSSSEHTQIHLMHHKSHAHAPHLARTHTHKHINDIQMHTRTRTRTRTRTHMQGCIAKKKTDPTRRPCFRASSIHSYSTLLNTRCVRGLCIFLSFLMHLQKYFWPPTPKK
jgi:hypothetical protein